MVLELPWNPWLELNAGHLLAFAAQIEQVLGLFYGIRYLSTLFGAFLLGQHIEIILEDIDRLIRLQSCII